MNLEIFKNENFEIRGGLINDEPYFVANDVSSLLGYANTYAMLERLDDDEKTSLKDLLKSRMPQNVDLPKIEGVRYDAVLLSESGVYNAILWSEKPEAKKIRRWITSEVLPSIRKHGAYLTPAKIEEVLLNPDTIIKLATDLKNEQTKTRTLEAQITADLPYTNFGKVAEFSGGSLLIRDFAKILASKGIDIGEKRLYNWFRDEKFIIQGGTEPYQKYVEAGYFERKPTLINRPNINFEAMTTKITPKGQVYFTQKLMEHFKKTA